MPAEISRLEVYMRRKSENAAAAVGSLPVTSLASTAGQHPRRAARAAPPLEARTGEKAA